MRLRRVRQTGGGLSDLPEDGEAGGQDLEGLMEIELEVGSKEIGDLIETLRRAF